MTIKYNVSTPTKYEIEWFYCALWTEKELQLILNRFLCIYVYCQMSPAKNKFLVCLLKSVSTIFFLFNESEIVFLEMLEKLFRFQKN